MRVLITAVQILVPLLLVLGVYLATMRDQIAMVRLANRDDWRELRDRATAVVERDSRFVPGAVRAHAAQLLGVAHLVLGDLPGARDALHRVLAGDPPAPVRAAAQRQLASIERTTGEVDAARARLEQPAASSGQDGSDVATQLALVLLDAGDPAGRARIAVDPAALDAAETDLRQIGALGHLWEVDQARREIGGLG